LSKTEWAELQAKNDEIRKKLIDELEQMKRTGIKGKVRWLLAHRLSEIPKKVPVQDAHRPAEVVEDCPDWEYHSTVLPSQAILDEMNAEWKRNRDRARAQSELPANSMYECEVCGAGFKDEPDFCAYCQGRVFTKVRRPTVRRLKLMGEQIARSLNAQYGVPIFDGRYDRIK
jgi:DNA-directed RNA polymerase subunit RPC12/RpoP